MRLRGRVDSSSSKQEKEKFSLIIISCAPPLARFYKKKIFIFSMKFHEKALINFVVFIFMAYTCKRKLNLIIAHRSAGMSFMLMLRLYPFAILIHHTRTFHHWEIASMRKPLPKKISILTHKDFYPEPLMICFMQTTTRGNIEADAHIVLMKMAL